MKNNEEIAIYAGGCFWGMEHLMKRWPGVKSVESGYTGGTVENPTYEQVKSKTTGHAEAVKVVFDPYITSYTALTRLFFEIHDPTQDDGQGIDIGPQYRSEIFYTSPEQKRIALELIAVLRSKGYDVVTQVTPATTFYRAEEYHQNYHDRNGGEPECHHFVRRF